MMKWLARLFGLKARADWSRVDWSQLQAGWIAVGGLSNGSVSQVKEALIKADSLLDLVMKQAGVDGVTFAERLKSQKETMPRSLYRSLWQAHQKRNELVHQPTSQIQPWEKTEYLKSFQEAYSYFRGQR
ncbi:MAG: hypothetical protein AAB499_01760 [Patescibacteria group bacterium]